MTAIVCTTVKAIVVHEITKYRAVTNLLQVIVHHSDTLFRISKTTQTITIKGISSEKRFIRSA